MRDKDKKIEIEKIKRDKNNCKENRLIPFLF